MIESDGLARPINLERFVNDEDPDRGVILAYVALIDTKGASCGTGKLVLPHIRVAGPVHSGRLNMAEVSREDAVVARNERVVRRFIDAWAALDVEAAMACLAANIVYINQPLEPVVGLANVRKIIQGILEQTKKVEWKLINVFGRGKTICTERLDCWDFDGNGWGLKLPCIGMFDVDADGKICGWRDYFDNQLWFKNGGPTLHI